MRKKSDDKQQNNLREEYHLPPMYFFVMLEVHVHNLGGSYTKYKRNNRNKVFENFACIAVKHRRAHQHNVTCLCIGKHAAARYICICVLKSTRKYDKQRRAEMVGHLTVEMLNLAHAGSLSFNIFSIVTIFVQRLKIVIALVISSTVANDGASLIFLSSGSIP